MKIVEKLRDLFERLIDAVSFSIFLFIALVGFYAIFDIHRVTTSAKLDNDVLAISSEMAAEPDHSFEELKAINDEIVAWLKVDDTTIDLPVVWYNRDNVKYLTRNYRGEYSTAGSAFVDYRNNGINDNYTVIYGHRMSDSKMFSDITKFLDAEYFSTHRAGTLYTPEKTYRLEFILAARPNVSDSHIYSVNLYRNANYSQILNMISADIVNQRDIEVSDNDKLLLLSTCDKDASHYRNVILARMAPKDF